MHIRRKMNNTLIRIALILFSFQAISCTHEEIILDPQGEETLLTQGRKIKLRAKYYDGLPIPNVPFTLTAFPLAADEEPFTTSGVTNFAGLLEIYLDDSKNWSHATLSSTDERFKGEIELEIADVKHTISHTWVIKGD